MTRRLAIVIAVTAVLAAAGTAFAYRVTIKETFTAAARPKLPEARPYRPPSLPAAEMPLEASAPAPAPKPGPQEASAPDPVPAPVPAPLNEPSGSEEQGAGVNLAVPFTSQAPHADWNLPYQEACEEASLLMANAYMLGAGGFTPEEADRQILALVEWSTKRFGYYEDQTAEEVALIAREYYGYGNAKVLPVSSIDDVKRQLDLGRVVILPAAGRLLGNPYFRGQGPLYHMLVAKGYASDGRIITNDPGTRRGADFLYDPDVLFAAIHDWNGGDVASGAKVMVVLE